MRKIINQIERFNKDLADAISTMDGDNSFIELDTTIIGDFSEIHPIEYKVTDKVIEFEIDEEQFKFEKIDGEYENVGCLEYISYDYFLDTIRYFKRRIKKSLKIWNSENPDTEIEREETEENNE